MDPISQDNPWTIVVDASTLVEENESRLTTTPASQLDLPTFPSSSSSSSKSFSNTSICSSLIREEQGTSNVSSLSISSAGSIVVPLPTSHQPFTPQKNSLISNTDNKHEASLTSNTTTTMISSPSSPFTIVSPLSSFPSLMLPTKLKLSQWSASTSSSSSSTSSSSSLYTSSELNNPWHLVPTFNTPHSSSHLPTAATTTTLSSSVPSSETSASSTTTSYPNTSYTYPSLDRRILFPRPFEAVLSSSTIATTQPNSLFSSSSSFPPQVPSEGPCFNLGLLLNVSINTAPEKGGAFFKYINYRITSLLSDEPVMRRYSDFFWLDSILKKKYPFRILATLPPKKIYPDPSFLERRRRGLQRYLLHLSCHPIFSMDPCVHVFFTYPETFSAYRSKYRSPISEQERQLVLDEIVNGEKEVESHSVLPNSMLTQCQLKCQQLIEKYPPLIRSFETRVRYLQELAKTCKSISGSTRALCTPEDTSTSHRYLLSEYSNCLDTLSRLEAELSQTSSLGLIEHLKYAFDLVLQCQVMLDHFHHFQSQTKKQLSSLEHYKSRSSFSNLDSEDQATMVQIIEKPLLYAERCLAEEIFWFNQTHEAWLDEWVKEEMRVWKQLGGYVYGIWKDLI